MDKRTSNKETFTWDKVNSTEAIVDSITGCAILEQWKIKYYKDLTGIWIALVILGNTDIFRKQKPNMYFVKGQVQKKTDDG